MPLLAAPFATGNNQGLIVSPGGKVQSIHEGWKMPDSDISPQQDSPRPQQGGHYRADDDIELPPIPEDAESVSSSNWSAESDQTRKPSGVTSVLGAVALMAALAVGGWFVMQEGSAEKQHPNWQHVAAATAASDGNSNQLVHVDGSGDSHVLPAIELSAADTNRDATQEVRRALRRNDLFMATAALQAAQQMPTASQNPDVRPPQIEEDSELVSDIKTGRKSFYEIELFDCCDEDGDIIELFVNGAPFATVPIVHRGTKLVIPLQQGNNTIAIRGIKDGGGGVTMSFRTSRGEYFARSLAVGEEHQMGVVVR
jgi:hypothetical protein